MPAQPADPTVMLLYLLHAPSEAGDGLTLGALTLAAAAVRSLAALLSDLTRKQTEPSTVAAAERDEGSLPSAQQALQVAAAAVARVVCEARGVAFVPPAPAAGKAAASAVKTPAPAPKATAPATATAPAPKAAVPADKAAAPAGTAAPRAEGELDPAVELDESALGQLAALFTLPSGGEVVDAKLCAWLRKMLEGGAAQPEPASVEE